MSALAYDLHIHSCLSPCGDPDMTPNNLVRMAKLKELDVIALTDHNSCRNCAAAVSAGRREGLLVLPGMELCTAEEIHVVCLFETLEGALAFSAQIDPLLPHVPNRPDIFGEQTVLDENDEPAGCEERLLLTAAQIGLSRVATLARHFGGAAFPAHIDRQAFGVLGVLGCIPPEAGFGCAELSGGCDRAAFLAAHPWAAEYALLQNSDAHTLWQISERGHFFDLPERTSGAVIAWLNRQKKP